MPNQILSSGQVAYARSRFVQTASQIFKRACPINVHWLLRCGRFRHQLLSARDGSGGCQLAASAGLCADRRHMAHLPRRSRRAAATARRPGCQTVSEPGVARIQHWCSQSAGPALQRHALASSGNISRLRGAAAAVRCQPSALYRQAVPKVDWLIH